MLWAICFRLCLGPYALGFALGHMLLVTYPYHNVINLVKVGTNAFSHAFCHAFGRAFGYALGYTLGYAFGYSFCCAGL